MANDQSEKPFTAKAGPCHGGIQLKRAAAQAAAWSNHAACSSACP